MDFSDISFKVKWRRKTFCASMLYFDDMMHPASRMHFLTSPKTNVELPASSSVTLSRWQVCLHLAHSSVKNSLKHLSVRHWINLLADPWSFKSTRNSVALTASKLLSRISEHSLARDFIILDDSVCIAKMISIYNLLFSNLAYWFCNRCCQPIFNWTQSLMTLSWEKFCGFLIWTRILWLIYCHA